MKMNKYLRDIYENTNKQYKEKNKIAQKLKIQKE